LNKSSIVHAFEPFGEPFSILEKTAIANNGNIQIAHAALSDRTGKLQLYSWGGHLEGHKREEKQEPVYVSSITGDAYCFGIVPNIAPDFLKIDCEGSELKVLLGLNNVIYKHRPTILLELHSDQISKEEAIEISKFIGWYNYKVVSVETGNEMPLSNILEQKGELRVLLI
jgi:FkbM family methyltransferase